MVCDFKVLNFEKDMQYVTGTTIQWKVVFGKPLQGKTILERDPEKAPVVTAKDYAWHPTPNGFVSPSAFSDGVLVLQQIGTLTPALTDDQLLTRFQKITPF